MSTLDYICSACFKDRDECKCPWVERNGLEYKPPLVHRSTVEQAIQKQPQELNRPE